MKRRDAFTAPFAEALRRACARDGLTQQQLGERIAAHQHRHRPRGPERERAIAAAKRQWPRRISAWKQGERLPSTLDELFLALDVVAPDAPRSQWKAWWLEARGTGPGAAASLPGAAFSDDGASEPALEHDEDDVEILGATPAHLHANCVIPQSLDDQWVPHGLMQPLLRQRRSLATMQEDRLPLVRGEYVRALLTARQVVVNRMYLYRNPVISGDYTSEGPDRAAFEQLLAERALVPFLFRERSPVAAPDAADAQFRPESAAWNEICRSRPIFCVRLSWNDTTNDVLVARLLSEPFAHGVERASQLRPHLFLRDMPGSFTQRDEEGLLSRLSELALTRRPSRSIPLTRTELYKRFVLIEGSAVTDGNYDPDKPYVIAIKYFLDLLYNMNLARALGRALVTPTDSLHHSVLMRDQNDVGLYVSVMEIIQNALFVMTTRARPLDLFRNLTLTDVVAIRSTSQWQDYAATVDSLLESPWMASHPSRGIPGVFRLYKRLIRHVGEYQQRPGVST